jgi:DNA segregation ATPase FtsK/SpoIIIE, S-DNA-T family
MDPADANRAPLTNRPHRRPGRLAQLLHSAAATARIPDSPPPPQPAVTPTWNPLTYLRQQRAGRPRWQRLGFLGLVGTVVALTLGVGPTVAAAVGPAGVVAAWPILEWPGRLVAAAAGAGWAVLVLGWRSAVPVIGLTIFARWFGDTTTEDWDEDDAELLRLPAPGVVLAGRSSRQAVPQAVPPDPDSPVARTVARWGQIAEAAGGGLAGSHLKKISVSPFGWAGPLQLRPGVTLEDAQARRRNLDSALGARPGSVRLDQDPARADRVLLRVVERDPLEKPTRWPGPSITTVAQPLSLGLYEDATMMRLPIAGQCVLIAGIRGAGKSGVLNDVVGELAACPDVVLWGLDLKHGLELGPWTPVFDRIASTLADAEALLDAAERVMTAHGQLLAHERGDKEWRPTPQRPALVLVCDEQGRLRDSAAAISKLETIASQGRALGVWLVSATQYPTVEVLGSSELRAQYTCTVLLRVQRKQHVNVVLGEGAATAGWAAHEIDPGRPGVCYLHAPGATTPKLGRAWQLTDRMVSQVAAHYAPCRPNLHPDAAHAASAVPHQDTSSQSSPSSPPSPSVLTLDRPAWLTTAVDGRPVPGPFPALPSPIRDSNSTARPAEDSDRALQILVRTLQGAGPAGRTIGELKTATGMSRSWVYLRLSELVDAGAATRVDRGRWRLTTSVHDPAAGHRP